MSIMNRKNSGVFRRGIVPFVVALIVAASVLVIGSGYLVATRTAFGRNLATKIGLGGIVERAADETSGSTGGPKTVADVSVSAPSFDFSFSPVPSLDTAAFNLGVAGAGSTAGAFGGLSFSSNFGVDVNLDVAEPTIDASKMTPTKLALPPASPTPPVGTTPPSGTTPPAGSTPSPGAAVSSTTCAQFASMPSAQYCSAVPDPNGRALCEACKAAGY